MFQVVFRGSVPIAWFELRGVRVLFARDMQPALLRRTTKRTSCGTTTGTRRPIRSPSQAIDDSRVAAAKDSWALGIGLSASLAQLGKIIELTAFVLSCRATTRTAC